MSKNAVNRVTTAVGGLVEKIEKLGDDYANKLAELGDAAEQKLKAVDAQVIDPVMEALSKLDDILFGDNGGPSLDGAEFPETIRDAAGQSIEARPAAATAAAPQASALGAPTGGITSADIAKKPE
jgi:hypothetical protein